MSIQTQTQSEVGDAFFDVPKTRRETSQGEVDFPIAYYDTSELIALFEADPEPVRQAMRDVRLSPVLIGGKARIALVFFEYRDTSIGPYNEVGLATLAMPEGESAPPSLVSAIDVLRNPRKRRVGIHVLKLPVTTAIANAAGREMWGFPKFVTPIDVDLGDSTFSGRVADPDDPQKDILKLSGKLPPRLPVPPVGLMLLSQLDGTVLRTIVEARGPHRGGPARGLQLKVGDSAHPMATQLRDLGLDGARPDLAVYTHRAKSLLYLGDPV